MIMNNNIEYNLGEQPIAKIMLEQNLKSQDLVAVSTEQITHKMVTRACKGRRLKPRIQAKVCNALNTLMNKNYSVKDLFTY
jgi:type II secretory pathway component PulF